MFAKSLEDIFGAELVSFEVVVAGMGIWDTDYYINCVPALRFGSGGKIILANTVFDSLFMLYHTVLPFELFCTWE